MSKIDLGSVSAFDIAVKNGYAGTEADWVNDIANASESAEIAERSATQAQQSASQALSAAGESKADYTEVASDVEVLTARMDEFTSLEEGSTTGDAELADIRVGADGETYQSAGTAVRTQISNIVTKTGDLEELETEEKTNLVDAINEASRSGGGGLTDTQKELIITILRNALYSSDQSSNIDDLEDAFVKTVTQVNALLALGENVIYSDDTLDTLRQYLTVRATYDDGSIQVVTGYTLSGRLTVGTSVVNINYKGIYTSVEVPVSQAVTRYTITNNLTGVTNSNTEATIPEGNTYTGVLSADTAGYVPTSVSVQVGGTDVTSTAYNSSTQVITIENVQGDIVISAVGALDPTLPVYTLASPMTEGGTVDCVLFDQVQDWTIELTVDTPANSGNVTIHNKSATASYYPFRIGVNYVTGIDVLKVWNSGDPLNKSWLDGTIAGTQKVVITYDADGDSIGYWKQTNMKSGHESYGQGSQTIAAGTTITPNEEPFTVAITGSATLSDLKIYKRVLTKEEISEYVGWTVE